MQRQITRSTEFLIYLQQFQFHPQVSTKDDEMSYSSGQADYRDKEAFFHKWKTFHSQGFPHLQFYCYSISRITETRQDMVVGRLTNVPRM